ncbi:hypothetical protein ACWT_2737 [Actinoplanes sp. SE50]|uniref:DUF6193 family natural product biosynthesis protein n=1 Tax=unclassified Actinoplanes TaxID=2626549 RepID=UPI00023EC942|nr:MULTISPECIES: DUF6193 family natural product biosynthesis protein [unclassified Actinoplanes]AEV83704.1 hypothetical protein ACPL_2809 [Actinoplanes sp. SE50/110]ATO82152.1 hypothetical protein ACWT_2737 [Actinoplanes sp. SE50]SLL99559.1 hypothetical protein ACSP50_2790 [Actinoplanes sp. SE50/110]
MSDRMAELYPEVVRAGGLAEALRRAAAARDVDLGPALEQSSARWSASIDAPHGGCEVSVGAEQRFFHVEIRRSDYRATWVSGAAPELDPVAGVILAWLAGESAAAVSARFPFVTAGEFADVAGDDEMVAAQWRSLLAAPEYRDERPLLAAVHRSPRARRLFPVLTHGMLRLSADMGRVGGREIRIVPLRHGGHRIEDGAGTVLATLESLLSLDPLLDLDS